MLNNFTITIDPIYKTDNFSVQIDDHNNQKTIILDDAFHDITIAAKAAQNYVEERIGARRQLGGKRSSKPLHSVSKTEFVGSIPTAPAKTTKGTNNE
tara:strand:- start:236 stop:526 length:291 start_codon:yes stop_codon:yes gene_type:complete